MTLPAAKPGFDWAALLKQTKENLAKILWGVAGLSEGPRELALKETLWEMEQLQRKIEEATARWENAERIHREENELLRSLLGTNETELRGRVLALAQDIHNLRKDLLTAQEEAVALRGRNAELQESDENLRRALKESGRRVEELEALRARAWESQMSGFAEEQAALQKQMSGLNEELGRVQSLMDRQSRELTDEKQAELAAQRAKLLAEMEAALRQKEELLWAEEELFARGVAQKLRGELQSAQGRLQLTLERFRLLETDAPQAGGWEQWWRMLKVGPEELRKGFSDVGRELRQAVQTLEEYLALTRRKAPARESVNVGELVRGRVAKLYAGRVDKGALEVFVPDVLPQVDGDAELLAFAAQALLDNAFEALPRSGGRVRVAVEKSPDGAEVWVSVSDTGGGVPEGRRDRLFQPFFTTKEGHRGLSLARARRYAEWHRGSLELVESGAGGSVFRLRLPAGAAA
jgi:signal transduction histidine kinase